MKLPHVIVLSIIGMLVASLSVIVFTSPRELPPRQTLPSNEHDADVPHATSSAPSSAPQPHVIVPNTSSAAPIVSVSIAPSTSRGRRSVFETLGSNSPDLGKLQLISNGDPCMFFVDGEPVILGKSITLAVMPGAYAIKCERINGSIERGASVVAATTTPVSF